MHLTAEERSELIESYVDVLRDSRERLKISQAMLAEKVGLSEKYITLIEGGRKVPSLETLISMMAGAGVRREVVEAMLSDVLDNFSWREGF